MKTSLKLLLLCALFVLAPMARAQDTFTINVGDCVSEGRIFPNGTAGGCDAALPNTPTAGAGNLETAGATDTYSFAANAGDFVFVEPRLYAGNGQPVNWRVVAPSGTVLFNQQLQPQRGSAPPRFDLTETGTYQIIVGEGSGFVGGYQFALWNVPAPTTTPITFGNPITRDTVAPGVVDTYTFDATQGQFVYFESFAVCCDEFTNSLIWTLETPTNQVLFQRSVRPRPEEIPTDEVGTPLINPSGSLFFEMPDTGTYRLTIGTVDNPYRGNYNFIVNLLGVDAGLLAIPNVVGFGYPTAGAGAIFGNNLLDFFFFDGVAGQNITLSAQNLQSPTTTRFDLVRWTLLAPSSAVIFDRSFSNDAFTTAPFNIQLPESGRYSLVVYGLGRVDMVYGFNISFAPNQGVLPYRIFFTEFNIGPITVPFEEGLLNGFSGSTVTLQRDGFFGNALVNPDGSFTYIPGPQYTEYDEFIYTINAPQGVFTGVAAIVVLTRVQSDQYLLDNAQQSLDIPASRGVLANDFDVTVAEYVPEPFGDGVTYPRNGTLDLRPDGSFTYQPDPGFTGADFFYYRDGGPNALPSPAEVFIGIGSLVVRVPGPQFTPVDTPLDVPGVSVETNQAQITVELRVENGVLVINDVPGVVAQAFPDEPPPMVTGNGTGTVTLTGSRDAVNAALANLVYTPNQGFQGIDELVVVGATVVQGRDVADTQTVVITVGASGESTVQTRSGPADPSVLSLLTTLSQQPGTIIRGTVPAGAVPGGDVYVRVLADTGEVLVPVAELGDTALIELGILNSAEVFGLSAGGATVPTFAQSVEVCLRGSGGFYYRDATGMPRGTQQMTTRSSGGFTCTDIPNSGTVILVRDGVMLAEDVSDSVLLDGCMVTTRNILNLREGPSTADSILRPIPFNVTLTALERQGNWFFVDYLGLFGWVSGDFLTLEGTCG